MTTTQNDAAKAGGLVGDMDGYSLVENLLLSGLAR
jgi:hypothetical protein